MLLAPWFALAGLIAAAGPLLIHLLSRQRQQVIEWGAMDFLREAIQRSRRNLRLHDLLLLALRMFCVAAFGLAMARPFFGSAEGALKPGQPVHAVLLIDNSLSMEYALGRQLEGDADRKSTLLDAARTRAEALIEELPSGSRISVLPTCLPDDTYGSPAYTNRQDALEAVAAIRPADRSARLDAALDRAAKACRQVDDPAAKQITLLADRQLVDSPAEWLGDRLAELPGPLEVIEIEPEGPPANAWVAEVRLRDGFADLQTPAVLLATVRYEGPEVKRGVDVSLAVDGVPFFRRRVDLQPGQKREIEFPPYTFRAAQFAALRDSRRSKGQIAVAVARVSIDGAGGETLDGLAADDERFLAVPVAASLPVVFIDEWGDREDPRTDRIGETAPLRRLLAPKSARTPRRQPMIEVRQRRIEQFDRSLLEDARAVVVAGLESPGPESAVKLLRAYVEQGGNLVIAAGGRFDPQAWNAAAWLDGEGILPAKLADAVIDVMPTSGARPREPLYLDYDSLKNHDAFLLDDNSEEDLRALYRLPLFFRAVEAVVDAPATVSARYTNGMPFLVERRIGRGRVLLVTTGFRPPPQGWNTMAWVNTVLIYDRIVRDLLQDTLPRRNVDCQGGFLLPVGSADREAHLLLEGPNRTERALSVDATGEGRWGVRIGGIARRGAYRVTAQRQSASKHDEGDSPLWSIPLAVNGPAEESQLRPPQAASSSGASEPVSLQTAAAASGGGGGRTEVRGAGSWRWIVAAVMACLLGELVLLARPARRREAAA